jgi:hypothetical protein
VNRRFGGTYHHVLGRNLAKQETGLQQVAKQLFSTLRMGVKCSSETPVHIRIIGRYIPDDGSIHNQTSNPCMFSKLPADYFFSRTSMKHVETFVNISRYCRPTLTKIGRRKKKKLEQ